MTDLAGRIEKYFTTENPLDRESPYDLLRLSMYHSEALQRENEELKAENAALRKQMEWVSVEERLPENTEPEEFQVVQYRYRDEESRRKYGSERVINLRWRNPGDSKFLGETKSNPVTHWMPLPTPPGESQVLPQSVDAQEN